MKIIYAGTPFDVEDGMTLSQFVASHATMNEKYVVNGRAVDPATVLTNYQVVEQNPEGILVSVATNVSMVTVNLSDFTGRSGNTEVANSLDAVRELYSQPVRINVIRDEFMVENPTNLQTGDRVLVAPAGGVKGA